MIISFKIKSIFRVVMYACKLFLHLNYKFYPHTLFVLSVCFLVKNSKQNAGSAGVKIKQLFHDLEKHSRIVEQNREFQLVEMLYFTEN